MRINFTDRLLDPSIEIEEAGVQFISGLVQGIESGDPCVSFVSLALSAVAGLGNDRMLTSAMCSQIMTARSWKSLCTQTTIISPVLAERA